MSGDKERKEGGREHREYVVAALLHDIGKLIRRARLCREGRAGRHAEESIHFVELIENVLRAAGLDVNFVKQFIARHHEDGGIAPYDRAAALERKAHGDDESREGLAIAGRREEDIPLAVYADGRALYVPPCPLPASLEEAEQLVPQELPPHDRVCECYVRSYERLQRLAAVLNARAMGYQQLVEALLYTLRSTSTFVPAAVYGVSVPDTSLYAHSLLSAALASTGGEFVLVALDVGKIQDYMRRVRVTKGAMALLRGRSLMVSLLQRVAVRWLIDEVNKKLGGADIVTWANVLLDTGGEVLLILPHVKGLDGLLEQLERRVLEDTRGALALYAARVGPCRLGDLEKFESLLKELEQAVYVRKMRYVEYSARSGGAPNARSPRGQYAFYSEICEFCGRPAKTAERQIRDARFELCDECWGEYAAGIAARNLQALVIARGRSHAGEAELERRHGCDIAPFSFLGYTVFVAGGGGCDPDAVAGTAAQLMRDSNPVVYFANRPADFIRGHDGIGYGFVFTNQYLPRENGGVMSLESVRPAVFIKADANEMGRRKDRASERPSLLVTFSTAVSTAYELYPALLASERQRENIFVIYAGGDDLALAGDLSALKYIARVVEYAERWGFRTAVGVKIDEPYLPVYYAWTETDLRLKRAKDYGRDRSIAVVITDPVEIAVDVAELGTIYDCAAPDEIAGEELGRLARIVYLKLFEAYAQLVALKRGAAGQQRLAACRELARVFVELAYVLNRRMDEEGVEEFLDWLKRMSGLDLTPDKLPGVYEVACGKRDGASGVEEMLRKAILGLYLAFLKRRAERAGSS
jgi:CRISPR-associated protein Csm1